MRVSFAAVLGLAAALSACGDNLDPAAGGPTGAGGSGGSGPTGPSGTSPDGGLPINEVVLIQSVEPASGPATGGATITITGRGFQQFNAVLIGGNSAVDSVRVDAAGTTLIATTPPGHAGPADVRVENTLGIGLKAGGYQYIENVTCASVTPEILEPEGGGTVTITGTGFGEGSEVSIGGRPADDVHFDPAKPNELTAIVPIGSPGRQNVRVRNMTGTGVCEAAVYYKDQLLLLSALPPRGPLAGGTEVVLVGDGLLAEGPTTVTFNGEPAEVLSLETTDRMTVRTPPGMQGAARVQVSNLNGDTVSTNIFFYFESVEIDRVTPATSPTDGGVVFRVEGRGMTAESVVTVGGRSAIGVRVIEDGTILEATTPPGDVGAADVRVVNLNGSALARGAITYHELLAVETVTPAGGPATGGNLVALSGRGFTRQTRVRFGANEATGLRFLNTRNLTAVVPVGHAGPTTVCVLEGEGDAAEQACQVNAYVYFDATAVGLRIYGVAPGRGPLVGGTDVALVGTGFGAAGFAVDFGGVPAASIVVQSPNLARVRTPAAAAAGPVDVTVSDETAAASLAAGFQYFQTVGCETPAPSSGPVAGGTALTIRGEGFGPTSRVRIGSLHAETHFVDATTLEVVTPPGSVGPVDVLVENGATRCRVRDGFVYLDRLQLFALTPTSGATAGGTLVTVVGNGFTPGVEVFFGDVAAAETNVIDAATIQVRTPAGVPGPVDVSVRREEEMAALPRSYVYFDPTVGFGGTGGGPIVGAVNVTVLNDSGAAVENAVVVLGTDPETRFQGRTNAAGQVVISYEDLIGPQRVTASAEGYASASILYVDAQNVTLVLIAIPDPQPGAPGEGPGPPIVRGTLSIDTKFFWDLLNSNLGERACARVATTAIGLGGDAANPPAGDGAIVFFSDPPTPGGTVTFRDHGDFEIVARPGEISLYAIAGACRNQNGTLIMTQPVAMGWKHFLTTEVDTTLEDQDFYVGIPLKQDIPTRFVNPPRGQGAPDTFIVEPFVRYGDSLWWAPTRETYIPPGGIFPEVDPFWGNFVVAERSAEVLITDMPELHPGGAWEPDATALGTPSYFLSAQFVSTSGGQVGVPLVENAVEDITEVFGPDRPVLIDPVVQVGETVTPRDGDRPRNNHFAFRFLDGGAPSDANVVMFFTLSLFGPVLQWYVVLPGDQTEFDLPDLTQWELQGLPQGGFVIWQLSSMAFDDDFSIDSFDLFDVLAGGARSTGVNVHFFQN